MSNGDSPEQTVLSQVLSWTIRISATTEEPEGQKLRMSKLPVGRLTEEWTQRKGLGEAEQLLFH